MTTAWLKDKADWLTKTIFGEKRELVDVGYDYDEISTEQPKTKRAKLDCATDDDEPTTEVEKTDESSQRVKHEPPKMKRELQKVEHELQTMKKESDTLEDKAEKTIAKANRTNDISEDETESPDEKHSISEITAPHAGEKQSSSKAPTASCSFTLVNPYDEFTEENIVKYGVFIFVDECHWEYAPLVVDNVTDIQDSGSVNKESLGGAQGGAAGHENTITSAGMNTAAPTPPDGSIITRGCTYMTQGQLPENTRFAVVRGVHPMLPMMTNFYAIGIVLSNCNNRVVVDFLKSGDLADLQHQTRDALIRQLPGLISVTRLAEIWRLAVGSLELYTPPEANVLNEDEFMSQGPMVYHGSFGWSFCRGTLCWVVTGSMPQIRRRHVVVVGHPFSQRPEEYAIGVVVKLGAHLSLVDFHVAGLVTTLAPTTVSALVGRFQPHSSLDLARKDLWMQATTPMKQLW